MIAMQCFIITENTLSNFIYNDKDLSQVRFSNPTGERSNIFVHELKTKIFIHVFKVNIILIQILFNTNIIAKDIYKYY